VPDLKVWVLLLHILAAFAWVAGYAATNFLTEFARRSDDPAYRRQALAFSSRFDKVLNQRGGTATFISGALALWVFGYSLLTPWILGSIVLVVGIVGLGITYWTRFGGRVDAAIASGDEAALSRVLREPRSIAVSRIENLMMVALITVMVLRPGS